MGFHEDDRIRNKNFALNRAGELFSHYRDLKWSHGDIAAAAEDEPHKDPKNRVAYELLKLAVREDTKSVLLGSNED